MINILVIGAGTMGRTHIRAYQAMDQVQIVGVVDQDQEKTKQLNDNGAELFTSFEEALQSLETIDVVDVCLPTYLHREYAEKSIKKGFHVICEKPLARTLEDAAKIVKMAESNGVRLFVGHVLRFFPEYRLAKKVIESGEIGKPGVVRTSRIGGFPNAWNDWYASYKNSGGIVLDLIIHDFDFLKYCFGDVERVYAKSLLGRNYIRKDYALVTLRFKNQMIAHVEGSWSHEQFTTKYEIAGDKGIIEYDSSKERPLTTLIKDNVNKTNGVSVPESPLIESPYYLELKHFIECIQNGQEALVTPEDAYKAVEISLAALQSIETGQPVILN